MGILTVIPKNELYVDFTTYKYVFIFFISAAIVIFVILYFVIPRYFSEPVTKLLKQMEKIRKPEEYQKIQVSGYSEISEIGNGVNEMMHFGELLPRLIIVLCWNKVQQAVLKLQKVITLKICMKLEK